ncbi:hypothetical protein BABINDRAFT_159217 [Babjeviella inositovora NRRL Y-12698]|uniref:STAS domain-containing protein n=1 Tax=Babjeviella inositovora NRRL Y-12698 TaxID=984486 RepID=A0A1E3QYI5_9ASCO|nr:uncharacterized protein BABINDRAFT_159217 [Babjeviella inositovora NRRL Y-12698]ODQ82688.1 hypothetical protein BABINDRAFT_159217 [Babjeviella inositovora NRRL Y-12698]
MSDAKPLATPAAASVTAAAAAGAATPLLTPRRSAERSRQYLNSRNITTLRPQISRTNTEPITSSPLSIVKRQDTLRSPTPPRGRTSTNKPSAEAPRRGLVSSDHLAATTVLDTYTPQRTSKLDFWTLLPYYVPCALWIPSYTLTAFVGDFFAGLSLASFQIPLSMSYAHALAHVPTVSGLFGLAICPIIYAVFGSVPQMIVGPESAISLIVGQSVEPMLLHNPNINPLDIAVVISSISGAILLGFGIGRFGFLDNILSSALLRGFILGVGVAMIVNSLVSELGLNKFLTADPAKHYHSPFDKLVFLLENRGNVHVLTAAISLVAFLLLVYFKIVKKQLIGAGFKKAIFFPEILSVVLLSVGLSTYFDWEKSHVAIVGKIQQLSFEMRMPFTGERMALTRELFSVSFTVAMLGFFESTTASKSLGSTYNLPISSNRELVALGAINIFGSAFAGLPCFGGYGRSKINAMSGATTVVSGLVMGCVTLFTISYLLPYIENLPTCILSVITTIVGFSLLEEAPHDIAFHWLARGWGELVTFAITVSATIFYSVEAGIALGLGYSLIRVIKHSTKSRIQILVRIPDSDTFVNADEPLADEMDTVLVDAVMEEIAGCLIIKVPEPLTFTNANDLKTRLGRVDLYGSTRIHPAAPRTRSEEMTRYVVFDLHGMTNLDSSAAQILKEIIAAYRKRGIHVFFTRVPATQHVRIRLRDSGIMAMTERHYVETDTGITCLHYFNELNDALMVVDQMEGMDNFSEY